MLSKTWWADLYLIPSDEDEKFILYSPSKYAVALVTPDNASKLATVIQGAVVDNASEKDPASSVISRLRDLGFLDPTLPNKAPAFSSFTDCRATAVGHGSIKHFSPHEVTLDITRKCNMRCVYCYSNGGESAVSMQPDCGRAAINHCNSPFE
ncbi:MAG: hypothetical protein M1495_25235 [Bacteroidetes bacterium]|nr:hypothetical protein [Bacteroidota bacterium]MCL6099113.1 hypothetical protein [Bacteroidota bacterium]